jgi:hypothetical protein
VRPALLLDPQASPRPRHERWPGLDGDGVVTADVYDLSGLDLEPYAALLVAGMVDQEYLMTCRDTVARFLGRGRVVVFCGHLFRPWLPGCPPFVPAAIATVGDYAVHVEEAPLERIPVFASVDPDDLTYRRGVAGFFARGHHDPPPGATVLARLAGGQPITWVDEQATPGAVLVHAGADLLGYGADDSSASRVGPQLVDWARRRGSGP